jgi:hypothetical protein
MTQVESNREGKNWQRSELLNPERRSEKPDERLQQTHNRTIPEVAGQGCSIRQGQGIYSDAFGGVPPSRDFMRGIKVTIRSTFDSA